MRRTNNTSDRRDHACLKALSAFYRNSPAQRLLCRDRAVSAFAHAKRRRLSVAAKSDVEIERVYIVRLLLRACLPLVFRARLPRLGRKVRCQAHLIETALGESNRFPEHVADSEGEVFAGDGGSGGRSQLEPQSLDLGDFDVEVHNRSATSTNGIVERGHLRLTLALKALD